MLGQGLPLAIAIFAILAMREPVRTQVANENRKLRHTYVELWRYRARVLPLLSGCALLGGIADGAAIIWATPTLIRSFGLSPERAGTIMASVLLISGIVGPILGGAIADRGQRTGGPYRTAALMTAVVLLSIPMGAFALAPGFVSASVLLTLYLTLGTAFQVTIMPLATIVIPSELRASCLALMAAVGATFGFALAPLMVSQLSMALGGASMIDESLAMVCVTFSVLSVFAFSFGTRSFRGLATERPRARDTDAGAEAALQLKNRP
jgi:MFS family permease